MQKYFDDKSVQSQFSFRRYSASSPRLLQSFNNEVCTTRRSLEYCKDPVRTFRCRWYHTSGAPEMSGNGRKMNVLQNVSISLSGEGAVGVQVFEIIYIEDTIATSAFSQLSLATQVRFPGH